MDLALTITLMSKNKNTKLNLPFLLRVEKVQLPQALEHIELRRRVSILQMSMCVTSTAHYSKQYHHCTQLERELQGHPYP